MHFIARGIVRPPPGAAQIVVVYPASVVLPFLCAAAHRRRAAAAILARASALITRLLLCFEWLPVDEGLPAPSSARIAASSRSRSCSS